MAVKPLPPLSCLLAGLAGSGLVLLAAFLSPASISLSPSQAARATCVATFGAGPVGMGAASTRFCSTSDAWLRKYLIPGNFVMAYVLRDPDRDLDRRPDLPGTATGGWEWGRMPGYSIRSSNTDEIDMEAVVSRVTHQSRVPEAVARKLMGELLDNRVVLDIAACFTPRHLLVFYAPHGAPVSVVEICFTCRRYVIIQPGEPTLHMGSGDLVAVAEVFAAEGLPLGPGVSSLEGFAEGLRQGREDLVRFEDDQAAEDEANGESGWR